jgi:CubicO group peptidase (beta-lactamase class C family)
MVLIPVTKHCYRHHKINQAMYTPATRSVHPVFTPLHLGRSAVTVIHKVQFVACLLLLAASQPLAAQLPAAPAKQAGRWPLLNRIDSLVNASLQQQQIAGAAALVVKDGQVVYRKAFGYADKEQGLPMKTNAIFRIASQTKALTSVAVLMLVEQGKLALTDPVSRYIPAFAHPTVLQEFHPEDTTFTTVPASREITVHDLLTHTSGIDYAQIGSDKMKAIYARYNIQAGFLREPLQLKRTIETLGRLPLATQPGSRFLYGLNTDVLGYLVEVVSGQSLARFLETRLFRPLGMKDTYFDLPAAKAGRVPVVYYEDTARRLVRWNDSFFPGVSTDYFLHTHGYYSGGAGLVSTLDDYAVFLQMLLNKGTYKGKRLLLPATVALMTSNQVGGISLGDNKFGLGFEIITPKGALKTGESAGSFQWGGFWGTTYWADPKEQLAGLLFLQQWPLRSDIHTEYRRVIYRALQAAR